MKTASSLQVLETDADLEGAGDAVIRVLQQDVVGLVARQPLDGKLGWHVG